MPPAFAGFGTRSVYPQLALWATDMPPASPAGMMRSMTKALVDQILNLPPADRLDLMDQIWESLARNPDLIPLPEEHRQDLDSRLESFRAAPDRVVAWESVRARYLKSPLKRDTLNLLLRRIR
jgi:putative addiction module component (TIGR02574 family)